MGVSAVDIITFNFFPNRQLCQRSRCVENKSHLLLHNHRKQSNLGCGFTPASHYRVDLLYTSTVLSSEPLVEEFASPGGTEGMC